MAETPDWRPILKIDTLDPDEWFACQWPERPWGHGIRWHLDRSFCGACHVRYQVDRLHMPTHQRNAVDTFIPLRFPRPFVPYPTSYGVKAPQRMTPAEWNQCTGIVGHQHVPENDHGDPGDLNRLIPLITQGEPMAVPDVEAAQRMLNSWLTADRQLRPDGDWGPASTAALRDILEYSERRIKELEAALINQPAMANSDATRKLAALRSALLEVVS